MITYLTNTQNGFSHVDAWENKCWINVINPSQADLGYLQGRFDVPQDFLSDISDIDERQRTETENGWDLIILRVPYKQEENSIPFITIPIGLLIKDDYLITVCYYETIVIEHFITYSQTKKILVNNNFDFFLHLFLASTIWYLNYLKKISTEINLIEKDLQKSIKNEKLHELIKFQKCLVFFRTSLKGNQTLLGKLKISRLIKANQIDNDLFEDVEIEAKQAMDMTDIYHDILSSMMNSFASVISNNLNTVMKRLTSISIILMIPTLISSLFGMNVYNSIESQQYAFGVIALISMAISLVAYYIFKKINWF